jgi:hypothetical protein
MNKSTENENSIYRSKILLIFGNSLSFISIFILLVQFLRSNNSETWDRLIYLGSIICGIFVFLFTLSSKYFKYKTYPIAATLILFFGIVGIEKHDTKATRGVDISKEFWLGFGPYILIVVLMIIPFVFTIYSWVGLNKKIQMILNFLAILVLIFVIPALWQGGNSIIDRGSNEYIINENLSVSAGYLPYVDFIPQYGTLYSWLLVPFKSYLDVDGLVTVSLYMMSIGTIIAILVGVWIAYKAMNCRSLGLAILLIVPLTSIAQFPNREVFSGTIFALLSQLPLRILPGMVLGLFLLRIIIKNQNNISVGKVILSFFSGLTIWINQDFALLAGLITLFFIIFYMNKILNSILIIISFILGILSYPIALYFRGIDINYNYIGFFATQYTSSASMSEPIITPGPILIILPWIITLVMISSYILIRDRYFKKFISKDVKLAILTTSFFSIWSLIGFAYYLNRSYASGQMQILFLPLSVASASLFGYLFREHLNVPWTPKSFLSYSNWSRLNLRKSVYYLLPAIIMSVPLSSIIAFPNPSIEAKRLLSSAPNNTWPKPNLIGSMRDAKFGLNLAKSKDLKIAFFGASGNYMKLSTGISSVNIFNSPWDMPMSDESVTVGCQRIFSLSPDLIVLGEEGPSLFRFANNTLCNQYIIQNIDGIQENRIAVRIN